MPGYTNPQNLNRYSYVGNSPLNYTDPTGHQRLRDGPTQDGFSQSVYDSYVPLPDPEDEDEESTQPSIIITLGLSLGSTQNVPNYYGDYEFNTNVPYFPGGNTQPNPCIGSGPARALCVLNLLTSIIPLARGPVNPSNNFFLTFTLTYDGNGIGMSDIQWANRYGGTARFSQLRVNNRSIPVPAGGNYLVNDGSYYPIEGSGAYTPNGEQLTVRAAIFTTVNTPLGLGEKPYIINYPP